MKSKRQKQIEALYRLERNTYQNSKAKRQGISQTIWQEQKEAAIANLKEKLFGKN